MAEGSGGSGGYIYVLHGPEAFTRDEVLRSLKQRARQLPAGEHNLTELSGSEATVAALQAAADTVPFLADRRLVVVHGLLGRLLGARERGGRARPRSGAKPSGNASSELQALLAYLPIVPATTSIAFVEGAGLPGEQLAEVTAAIPTARRLVRQYEKERNLATWIRRRAAALELDLDEAAIRDLADVGRDDLQRLDSELRKLAAFAAGQTVTREEVRLLVAQRDVLVWGLLDALVERREQEALSVYRRLLDQGEAPEAILSRDLAPLFRRLLVAKEVAALPRAERSALDVAALGLNPAALGRTTEQAAHFDADELERALELLLEADRWIKGGEMDPEVAVELLLARLCTRLRRYAPAASYT